MDRDRLRFAAALGLFAAWVAALGFLASTQAEKPPLLTPTSAQGR